MSWLRRVFGGGAPSRDWSVTVGEGPAGNWDGPFGVSPLHRLLDEIGVPWRETRGALEARLGVQTDAAYEWPVLPFHTDPPLVGGLLQPLSAQAWPDRSPFVPPVEFMAHAWFSDDARDNVRRCAEQLASRLGPNRVAMEYNTVRCEWTFGPALVRLTGWPRDLQTFKTSNPAHERDPRLATACSLRVCTGWRPEISDSETEWLADFRPLLRFSPDREAARIHATAAAERELEFVRTPPADVSRWLGAAGVGGEALIWADRQLCIVPLADVVGLKVERTLPGRGPGGAWLQVEARTGYVAEPAKWLTVARTNDSDGFNEAARTLAEAIDRPVEIGEAFYAD